MAMSTRRWLVVGGSIVVVIAVLLAVTRPRPAPAPPPIGSGGLIPAATATAPPMTSPPATDPTAGQTASQAPPATAPPTPSTPPTTPSNTLAPRATGDPRAAYAEFLLRVNDDRTTVEGLNRTLAAAAEVQDSDAVRIAAVAILDFVDLERDWLREHPPADCYAAAHAAANAMLDAYGTAADRFVTWSASGGGLDGLAALARAVDAAQAATDSLSAFATILGATRCPA
jgi:hypothetical protein